MLHTTFAKVKKANACRESYKKMAKALGGVTEYGKDKPFSLSKVLEVCGLLDTIWCFQCTLEPSANIRIEFACQCAEHVLHFYENKYPDDKRPHQAIKAARICITDKSSAAKAAASAASDAAWAAASAARAARAAWAASAAASAARAAWAASAASAASDAWAAWAASAARAAEIKWQSTTLLELLGKEG